MGNKRKRKYQRSASSKRQRTENDVGEVSPKKIVDVNNDCLEHVFNYLDLMDLINVAEASKQFGGAAASVFAHKYNGKTVEFQMYHFSNENQLQAFKMTNDTIVFQKPALAFKVVRLFGASIVNATIYGRSNIRRDLCKTLLVYVNEYCSETLKSFRLCDGPDFTYAGTKKSYVNVDEVLIKNGKIEFESSQFNETFPKMRRLELILTTFSDPKRFASSFDQLEHLNIVFIDLRDGLKMADAKKIIRLNPQLQHLCIWGDFNLKFWKCAAKQLKQLKVLQLHYDQDKFRNYPAHPIRFEHVENLKMIVPASYKKWKLEKVFAFKQLKECTIEGRLDDSWIDFVIANKQIEKLNIIKNQPYSLFLAKQDMMKIATKLPNLTELSMIRCSCAVNAVIRFLDKSRSIRKLSMTVFDRDDMDEIHSQIIPDWNATKENQFIVIERK